MVTGFSWICGLAERRWGDEDTCQDRQSTETLVALIKSKRQSSFNLKPPPTLSVFIYLKTKGHRWSVPIQEMAA